MVRKIYTPIVAASTLYNSIISLPVLFLFADQHTLQQEVNKLKEENKALKKEISAKYDSKLNQLSPNLTLNKKINDVRKIVFPLSKATKHIPEEKLLTLK